MPMRRSWKWAALAPWRCIDRRRVNSTYSGAVEPVVEPVSPEMSHELCVLISGNGANLQALIDAVSAGVIPNTKISLVISNRKNAFGLERAQKAGIATEYHNLVPYGKQYPSSDASVKYSKEAREAYDNDLAKIILKAKPSLVVAAGWMHILSDTFLDPLAQANIPIVNLHPALPGEYDGANAIQRAFFDAEQAFGKDLLAQRRTGCMIHYVIREVDRGKPIVTQEVKINAWDTIDELEFRMHAAEHELIVRGVKIALEEIQQA